MTLERLTSDHQDAFLSMAEDFKASDPATYHRLFGGKDLSPKTFIAFAKACETERREWRPKADQISVTHYVLKIEGQICGYGRMRFPLEDGDPPTGNLEFFVPPRCRGQGFGTLTLNRMLFEAVRAGLARALVVCERDNKAAIRCIEHNRGEKIDEEPDSDWLRFWIRFR